MIWLAIFFLIVWPLHVLLGDWVLWPIASAIVIYWLFFRPFMRKLREGFWPKWWLP